MGFVWFVRFARFVGYVVSAAFLGFVMFVVSVVSAVSVVSVGPTARPTVREALRAGVLQSTRQQKHEAILHRATEKTPDRVRLCEALS